MNNINSLIIKKGQWTNVGQMAVEVSGFTIKRDNGCYKAKESAWNNACPLGQQELGLRPQAKSQVLGQVLGRAHTTLDCRVWV